MTKELISKHSKSNNKTAATKLRRILKHFIDTFSSDKDNLKKSAFKEHVRFSFLWLRFSSTSQREMNALTRANTKREHSIRIFQSLL